MEIVLANKEFDIDAMHLDLMTIGVYVFHDPEMVGLIDPLTIEWVEEQPHQGIGAAHPGAFKFKDAQMKRIGSHFPQFMPCDPILYYGVDDGVGVWHTDAREHLGLQIICYQEDFTPEEGGSIAVRCYDGIERVYYPKNGDVLVLNHQVDTEHMVERVNSIKRRVAINLKLRRN